MQGFVQRRIVLVAFPDRAALIQCPDKRRTLSIIPHFNPAVGLHPACDIWIHLLKTHCSLWHCLLTPFLCVAICAGSSSNLCHCSQDTAFRHTVVKDLRKYHLVPPQTCSPSQSYSADITAS